MTNVTLPKIPRGNLRQVYVLSDKAADEFFREGAEIIKRHWSLPEIYTIPCTNETNIVLRSSPHIWISSYHETIAHKQIDVASFGVSVSYSFRSSATGLGKKILNFLSQTIPYDDHANVSNMNKGKLIPRGSHIFIYNLNSPSGIELPSKGAQYVAQDTLRTLEGSTKEAFKNISKEIVEAIEKRGAALTRGWLENQFVI